MSWQRLWTRSFRSALPTWCLIVDSVRLSTLDISLLESLLCDMHGNAAFGGLFGSAVELPLYFYIFPTLVKVNHSMIKTSLSSKGQVTIPRSFRKRMNLTGNQTVEMHQLSDGAVVLRSVPSILDLAGGLKPSRAILSPKEERSRAHQLMARRSTRP